MSPERVVSLVESAKLSDSDAFCTECGAPMLNYQNAYGEQLWCDCELNY